MTCLHSIVLIAAIVTSIITSAPTQAATISTATIETKTAIVITDTTDGNYFEFLDNTGGWWLETDEGHPTFEVGQILQFTIDTHGTEDLADDHILVIESLGFIE